MSVETLRQAAELLRERSRSATLGPWATGSGSLDVWIDQDLPNGHGICEMSKCTDELHVRDNRAADAAYVATVHPLVGLAVADLLEVAVPYARLVRGEEYPLVIKAMVVARAILGERVP